MATHGRWRGGGRGVVVVQWFYAGCGSKSSFRLPSGRSEFTQGSGVSQWLHSLGGWGGRGVAQWFYTFVIYSLVFYCNFVVWKFDNILRKTQF